MITHNFEYSRFGLFANGSLVLHIDKYLYSDRYTFTGVIFRELQIYPDNCRYRITNY